MNDLDLIRRFRAQVEPPDVDRVAAARALLRAQCDDAPRPQGRRVRPRPALAALLSVTAAAAVVAALVAGALGGRGTGTASAAIIRHADVALSPPPQRDPAHEGRGRRLRHRMVAAHQPAVLIHRRQGPRRLGARAGW